MRAAVPPFRKGMPGKVLPPRRLDFLPSGQLCGMKRPSILRLRCRRNAILPSKRSSRHLIEVTSLEGVLRGTCGDSTNPVRKDNIPRLTESNDMEKPKEAKNGFLLLGALLIAATALFVFGWLAEEMLEGDTQKFDEFVRNAVHRHATPALTWLMHGFSFLGSVAVVTTLCVLAIAAFLYNRQARTAALLAMTMVGMAVLDVTLKLAFHRPRPIGYFGPTPTTFSFPSGHAMGSVCFYGVLAAILAAGTSGRAAKWCIWTGAVLLIGMIGYSRIYLGVHYPSDVIAGYCAGAVWAGAVGLLNKIHTNGREEEVDRAKHG
jgi:undecaprenyl-diphosphatase